MWDETLPILVEGDFNIIRRRDEKNNDNFDGRWSMMFNMIIESFSLREIELTCRQFTWANTLPIQHMRSWIGCSLVGNGNKSTH